MFENLFGKKELGDDKNDVLTFHIRFSLASSLEEMNELCLTNPHKCRSNRKEFCRKTLEFLGYKKIKKSDEVCKLFAKLIKIKAIVTNESGTPSNRFVKCIAQHADEELKEFIIRNGYKIHDKKNASSCMLLNPQPADLDTIKINKN
jgi:hypothetical protein